MEILPITTESKPHEEHTRQWTKIENTKCLLVKIKYISLKTQLNFSSIGLLLDEV